MLLNIKNTNYVKDKNRIFQKRLDHTRRQYQRTKLKLAAKLQNPRINKIMLKTLRTWKATTLYHQTKDPWYVMEFLGHTTLQHTKKYVQLERALFQNQSDEFVCKIAKTPEEAMALIEFSFEYIDEINHVYLYRKRK